MRQMALSDYTSTINFAREEGMKEGRTDEKLEIAGKMKRMGDSLEKIHTITGLPIETIGQL